MRRGRRLCRFQIDFGVTAVHRALSQGVRPATPRLAPAPQSRRADLRPLADGASSRPAARTTLSVRSSSRRRQIASTPSVTSATILADARNSACSSASGRALCQATPAASAGTPTSVAAPSRDMNRFRWASPSAKRSARSSPRSSGIARLGLVVEGLFDEIRFVGLERLLHGARPRRRRLARR